MRLVSALLTLCALLTGCAPSPDHDNPVDPESPGFRPLPPRNHAPDVSAVRHAWDWRNGGESQSTHTAFEVTARVSDADENLLFYSVEAWIDTAFQGFMSYDPLRELFVLRRTQYDFPGAQIPFDDTDTVWVVAADDSSASTRSGTPFRRLVTEGFPSCHYPLNGQIVPLPLLFWWEAGATFESYAISVYLYGLFLVWDTSGIAPGPDSVRVGHSLEGGPLNDYSWYVTGVKANGDHLTSAPALFYVDTTLVAQQGPRGPQEYSDARE